MKVYEYGKKEAETVLVQMVDDHDLSVIDEEIEEIESSCRLVAMKVDSWNRNLSPWPAPPVFGSESFCGGAEDTLSYVVSLCSDRTRKYYIGGYSLAALFALWSVTKTDIFYGAACASPSLWFPSFTDYMKNNPVKTNVVYLSLGNKEAKTRNRVTASVAQKTLECRDIVLSQGVHCFFEWNEGGHFLDTGKRTARGFSYLLDRTAKNRFSLS